MTEFKDCKELIEFLLSNYSLTPTGEYLLDNEVIEVYGGMMPRFALHIISPEYFRTMFILNDETVVDNKISFGIVCNESRMDEILCVDIPLKFKWELYHTMDGSILDEEPFEE